MNSEITKMTLRIREQNEALRKEKDHLIDSPAIVGAMDVHFAAAISAVHKAGQRVDFAVAVRVAPDVGSDSLHVVKGFLVDDGLVAFSKIVHMLTST